MISKIAKATIEKWRSEGLEPSFEDIIHLNALGLKIEHASDVTSFAACPRVAFLGDWVLREPTVGKRAWMDSAVQLLNDDYHSHLYFTAWALNCPDDELPKLNTVKHLLKPVKEFAQEVLVHFTETQILMAIDYALNGVDQTRGENYTKEENDALKEVVEPPVEIMSDARRMMIEAMTHGIPAESIERVTVPVLDKMIVCALLAKGADILKEMKNSAAGAFYAEAGKIHTRLMNERMK